MKSLWIWPAVILALSECLVGQEISLLQPTGEFQLGTVIFQWTDPARRETASDDPHKKRELIAQIWYPAQVTSENHPAEYQPRRKAYAQLFGETGVEFLERIRPHSFSDTAVDPSQENYPVLLISHGWRSNRTELTTLAEELASHGNIVVGIDHPYLGVVALRDDWVTTPSETHFTSAQQTTTCYGEDVLFVLNQLERINRDSDSLFAGKFDLEQVTLAGHSSGFIGAQYAAKKDVRVRSLVNLDAPGTWDHEDSNKPLRVLWLVTEKATPVRGQSDVMTVTIRGGNHISCLDWSYLGAQTESERDRAKSVHREMSKVLREFLAGD